MTKDGQMVAEWEHCSLRNSVVLAISTHSLNIQYKDQIIKSHFNIGERKKISFK